MHKTTVLIPNYNGKDYIAACLDSIAAAGDYPVIIVDNGSCDGSAELIASKYPGVRLIRLPENTGFCHAVNVGLEKTETDYVFLLNNDTTVSPPAIEALENRMGSDSRIFSAQSRILSLKDPELIDDCGDLYCALGWAFARGKGKPANGRYTAPDSVFACCGAAVMYRMSVFGDIGYFDEEHFAYLEDIDLGYRARIGGYTNVYEPGSVIYHAGSATSGSRYNRFKVDLSAQNSIYLIYKNMPVPQIILNLPFLLAGFAIKTFFFILKGMGFTYIRGLLRGFAKCGRDMGNGHRHKVSFEMKNLFRYIVIQLELWINTVRRIGA